MIVVAVIGGLGLLLSSDKSAAWLKSLFVRKDGKAPIDKPDAKRQPLAIADELLGLAEWMRELGDQESAEALVKLAGVAVSHDARAKKGGGA